MSRHVVFYEVHALHTQGTPAHPQYPPP